MINNKILETAINKASKSKCRFRISALGFSRKGDLIGSATNLSRLSKYNGSIHAEINLIKKYGRKIKTILICRIGKSGELRPIDPCQNCYETAKALNITIKTIK